VTYFAQKKWLGWEDSNPRMRAPKARVLPLDDTPVLIDSF
jgi:hypothetical protein